MGKVQGKDGDGVQETGDIDTIFSALSYEQKEILIRLPFRVGVWISSSDSSGGEESEARELRALETVIASYAEEYLKSEFVQKLMEKTFAGKAGWSGWTRGIETVPEDCARLMSSLETLLPVRELDAFRENLLDIALAVAMVYREEGEVNESDAPETGIIGALRRLLGVASAQPVHSNISFAERKALSRLAAALKAPDPLRARTA